MNTTPRLRIAIQRKGRLANESLALLARLGLTFSGHADELLHPADGLCADLLRVRDDDIPTLIEQGACDVGVVGRNVLSERQASGAAVPGAWRTRGALGFGCCRLALAGPAAAKYRSAADLAGRRIATSYPGLTAQWLAAQGVQADVVSLAGSVELAPRLGMADAVVDLVSSGRTLRANQLVEWSTLLVSEAMLVVGTVPVGPRRDLLDQLLAALAHEQTTSAQPQVLAA